MDTAYIATNMPWTSKLTSGRKMCMTYMTVLTSKMNMLSTEMMIFQFVRLPLCQLAASPHTYLGKTYNELHTNGTEMGR